MGSNGTVNKDHLQTILDHTHQGVLVVNGSNKIVFANPTAGELFGTPAEELFNRTLPPSCTINGLSEVKHPGGQNRLLELNGTDMEWYGQPAHLVCVSDITRFKHTETSVQSLARHDDAINQLRQDVVQGMPLPALHDCVAQLLCDILDTNVSTVITCNPTNDTARLVAGVGCGDDNIGNYTISISDDTQASQTLRDGNPVVVNNWPNEKRFPESHAPREDGVISSICVAIPSIDDTANMPSGALCVYAKRARTFMPHDIDLMRRVAQVLSYAAEREHLFSEESDDSMLLWIAGQAARIGGWEIDPSAACVIWSDEVCAIHGLPAKRTVMALSKAAKFTAPESYEDGKQAMLSLLQHGEPFDQELSVITKQGKRIWIRAIGKPVYDDKGRVLRAHGAVQDITEQKRARDRIDFLALHDPLTELPNRWLLDDRLRGAMAACQRTGHKAALMLLDLDDFKTLNDTRGHSEGDLLLQQVATRLAEWQNDGDTVAHFGGDEFALIVGELDENEHKAAAQAELIGRKLLDDLRQPYRLGQIEYHSTQSLGITMFGFDSDDAVQLLQQVDLTMYEAKARGRNQVCMFDPEMQQTVEARARLESEIRRGIEHDEFQPYYQIQVDTDSKIAGAEVLARWLHPIHGMVSPADFIPLAETTGLILDLGRIMVEKACTQLAHWANNANTAGLHLAVNVSAQQFHHPNFVSDIEQITERTGANRRRLILELTETSILNNVDDTIAKMAALGRYGITFSLDDFGTGYSSLYCLKRLPLAQLKVDQSFVRNVDSDPDNATIVRTILALAGAMRLDVIAEGVETQAEHDFLAELGCRAHQGFLFGRPQPIEELQSVLYATNDAEAGLY